MAGVQHFSCGQHDHLPGCRARIRRQPDVDGYRRVAGRRSDDHPAGGYQDPADEGADMSTVPIKTYNKASVERRRLYLDYSCWLEDAEKLTDTQVTITPYTSSGPLTVA